MPARPDVDERDRKTGPRLVDRSVPIGPRCETRVHGPSYGHKEPANFKSELKAACPRWPIAYQTVRKSPLHLVRRCYPTPAVHVDTVTDADSLRLGNYLKTNVLYPTRGHLPDDPTGRSGLAFATIRIRRKRQDDGADCAGRPRRAMQSKEAPLVRRASVLEPEGRRMNTGRAFRFAMSGRSIPTTALPRKPRPVAVQ